MPRLPHPRTALSGYADHRLPAWRRAVVRHHLTGCTRCAVEVGQIRALREVLRSTSPAGQAPDELVDCLLAIGRPAPDPGAAEPGASDPGASDSGASDPGASDPGASDPGAVPSASPAQPRASVGAAGVLVAAVVMVGTVGAGAAVTGVPVPWPSATTRASVATVLLPRLWSGEEEPGGAGRGGAGPGGAGPGGAVSVQPVDNGPRP